MHVTVFGGSGKVGRLVVEELLQNGVTVTLFVHRHNPFTANENLQIVTGDITNVAAVKTALQGSDAVISTLSSWHSSDKTVLTTAMQLIIPRMKELGISRIVSLTGSDAVFSKDNQTFVQRGNHFVLRLIAPKVLADGEKHIELLNKSTLDWTVIRSPIMTRSRSTLYILKNNYALPGTTIPRRAVAAAMVAQLQAKDFIQQAPVIFRA